MLVPGLMSPLRPRAPVKLPVVSHRLLPRAPSSLPPSTGHRARAWAALLFIRVQTNE